MTAYYPPSNQGWGYMQLCEEVVDGLAALGHEVTVLTSTQCDGPDITRAYPVYRLLSIDPDWQSRNSAAQQFFFARRAREDAAVEALASVVRQCQPQVIFVWHAIGLPRKLLQAAEQVAPTAYYLAGYLPELPDEYIAYWQAQPLSGPARLLKHPLAGIALAMLRREGKPIHLKYEHVICVSGYVRQRLVDQHLIPATAVVIHNGVDVERFASARPPRAFDRPLALLCAGRLEPEKGVHHVIEALGLLDQEQRTRISHLSVVGDGQPAYRADLESLVAHYDLSAYVRFLPPVPRDEMPRLLDAHDVLIQPSALEALSRMMQEAMAMGLLLIGTNTGGSGEILVHEKTGLVFKAGDTASLAQQMACVGSTPALAAQLALAGQACVREAFDIRQTIHKVAVYLQRVVESAR